MNNSILEGTVGSSSEGEGEDLETLYSCPMCPKKFRSEQRFKVHQLLHNGKCVEKFI